MTDTVDNTNSEVRKAINAVFFSQNLFTSERHYLFQIPSDHEAKKIGSEGNHRLIGGIIEIGEDFYPAFIREALEETLGTKKAHHLLGIVEEAEPTEAEPADEDIKLTDEELEAARIIKRAVAHVAAGMYGKKLPPIYSYLFQPNRENPEQANWFDVLTHTISIPVSHEELALLARVARATAKQNGGQEEVKDMVLISENDLRERLSQEKYMAYGNEREALKAHLAWMEERKPSVSIDRKL